MSDPRPAPLTTHAKTAIRESKRFRMIDEALFRYDHSAGSLFYTPGIACVVPTSRVKVFQSSIGPQGSDWAKRLFERSRQAVAAETERRTQAFEPHCLTLYLNNRCNLGCRYCYAEPDPNDVEEIPLSAVHAAAARVARNCRKDHQIFHLVLHGGGEPTLSKERASQFLNIVEETVQRTGISLFKYIATNGVVSRSTARWMAKNFDLVGLSCDGPADIQNYQRPTIAGGATSQIVEKTADILHASGRPFHVRASIPSQIFDRQLEIYTYLAKRLKPALIRLEPVYVGGRNTDLPDHKQASAFLEGYFSATRSARQCAVPLEISGSRITSLHGRYCNVFRQVLNLIPENQTTACFKTNRAATAIKRGLTLHLPLDQETDTREIAHIQSLQALLGLAPEGCRTCFNRFHCTWGCPDFCPLEPESSSDRIGFRCRVARGIAFATIWSAVAPLWDLAERRSASYGHQFF